jgi:membrane-bound lytic murein transglycosylase F
MSIILNHLLGVGYRFCVLKDSNNLMLNRATKYGLIGSLLLLTGLWTSGCDKLTVRNDLEAIIDRGELVLITRNNTACYFEGPYGPAGFEYDLAKAFADHLGVRLRTLIIEDEQRMIEALRQGKADMIAAGIPFGNEAKRLITLGPTYLDVEHQIVGRRGGHRYKTIAELSDTAIWMTRSSSRLDTLKTYKSEHAGLSWKTLSDYSSEELLQMVWNRSLPLTMVESHTLSMNRRYYPELVVHFTVGQPQKLSWAIAPQSRHLRREALKWFSMSTTQKQLQGLVDHYFGHLEAFDYVDLARYRRRIAKRLPKYQEHFQEAAGKYGFDWHLVAALAYQESHWNPRAKSYTGVRGIMMLTQDTAKRLGLKNRLAVKESIFAGTRYLATLHAMVGVDVPEPDRTLLALAAYNLGFGHIRDARKLALELDKPADTWHGIRSVLPLLQKKKYYRNLPHGYARGNEAVQYVDRIRTYHKVLIMAMVPESHIGMGG